MAVGVDGGYTGVWGWAWELETKDIGTDSGYTGVGLGDKIGAFHRVSLLQGVASCRIGELRGIRKG